MLLLQISFFSPALMLVAAFAVVLIAKMRGVPIKMMGHLVWTSVVFALSGAVATLVLTIASMIWYEKTTGYSTGNSPLGWIFFYGPLGAASGQLVALVLWWFKSYTNAHDVASPAVERSATQVENVLRNYRSYGMLGGLIFGLLTGIFISGPNFTVWPALRSILVIFGSGFIGCLLGYFLSCLAIGSTTHSSGAGTYSSGFDPDISPGVHHFGGHDFGGHDSASCGSDGGDCGGGDV